MKKISNMLPKFSIMHLFEEFSYISMCFLMFRKIAEPLPSLSFSTMGGLLWPSIYDHKRPHSLWIFMAF